MTPVLVLTLGLPASGKTTFAYRWVTEHPDRRTRLNRDDFRAMMFGGWTGDEEHERAVTAAQHAAVAAALRAGWSVVCDDTNLREEFVQRFAAIAAEAGAVFEVHDLTGVPLQTCIDRDCVRLAMGQRHVGEQVIRDMHDRYLAEKVTTP